MGRVLIVDDDDDLVDSLCDLIEIQLHTARAASSGRQALELMQSEAFDLVLLDRQLSDMDGLELCRVYRGKGGNSRIVILSGSRGPDWERQCLEAGADQLLPKPVSLDAIAACLRANLSP